MSDLRQSLGRWGENLAADYLIQKGYQIIERNIRNSYREIDLVVRDGALVVFVEVKTRSTDSYGFPEASITPKKCEHLIATALAYIQASLINNPEWRIDVIAIRKLNSSQQHEIIHFKNAIS